MREHNRGHEGGPGRAASTAGHPPAIGAPSLTDLVLARAHGPDGERPALVEAGGTSVTYAALASQIERAILGHAERRHSVHVLAIDTTIDAIVDYLACLGAGRPVILADPARPDRAALLAQSFSSEQFGSHRATTVPHPDLALMLPTSGSTGTPRLVRQSHTNLVANAASIADYLGLTADDVAMTILPLHYCYGLSVLHSHLLVGASVVLTDASVADPGFLDRARHHGVTNLAGVPHTFALLERIGFADAAWPSLRFLTQAGGKLAADDVRRWALCGRRQGWDLFVMYGQTEATARMAYLPPELAIDHPHLVGKAIPGGRFEIVGPHGEPITDAGVEGSLVYHGPNVMMGYAETAADLALPPGEARRVTGDLARWSPEGLVEITGRASRFLKLFGLRVDLDQIERVAADAELEAWATGDDDRLVVAVRTTDRAATDRAATDELIAGVRAWLGTIVSLPPSAVAIVTVDEVPRLSNGKVDYPALRAAATTPEPTDNAAAGPALDVAGLLAAALGRPEVTIDDSFAGLGGDSLSYVEVSTELTATGVELPLDWPDRSVAELQALVDAATPPSDGPSGRLGALTRTRPLDTDVALRAVAILAIVASHFELIDLEGGAHILFGIIGANLARFHLAAVRTADGPSPLAWAAGRVAVPTLGWTALMGLAGLLGVGAAVSWANFALVTNFWPESPGSTKYWFIEVMVQLFVALAFLASSRRVRSFAIARPAEAGLALVAVGLALRFGLHAWWDPVPYDEKLPTMVLWLVGVGWLAQTWRSTTGRAWQRRLALSGLVVCGTMTLFDSATRNTFIAVGLLLLIWVPRVRLPGVLHVAVSAVASASLYIYLTHFQVTSTLGIEQPALRTAVAVTAGIAAARVAQPFMAWAEARIRATGGAAAR